jgi:hypothetical protein
MAKSLKVSFLLKLLFFGAFYHSGKLAFFISTQKDGFFVYPTRLSNLALPEKNCLSAWILDLELKKKFCISQAHRKQDPARFFISKNVKNERWLLYSIVAEAKIIFFTDDAS